MRLTLELTPPTTALTRSSNRSAPRRHRVLPTRLVSSMRVCAALSLQLNRLAITARLRHHPPDPLKRTSSLARVHCHLQTVWPVGCELMKDGEELVDHSRVSWDDVKGKIAFSY